MKKLIYFIPLFALLLLCSCSQDGYPEFTEVEVKETENDKFQEEAIANVRMKTAVDNESFDFSETFTSYSFVFNNYDEKYIVNAELGYFLDEEVIVLSIEDSLYNSSEYTILPPEGYIVNIPYSQDTGHTVCEVLRNEITAENLSDILKFDFYLKEFSDPQKSYQVSKFYAISGGRLNEIRIVDLTGQEFASGDESTGEANVYISLVQEESSARNITSETGFSYVANNVIMPEPVVYEDDNGRLQADVYIYEFNSDDMTLTKKKADTVNNRIYFGYSARAVADEVYKYVAVSSLDTSDFSDNVELNTGNSDVSEYYFKIKNPDFSNLESLKRWCRKYFSNDLTDIMTSKYRDINGELYSAISGDLISTKSGKTTITNIHEDNSVIEYRTQQEQLDPVTKAATGVFGDGGNFTVQIDSDGNFIVIQYKYSM